MHPIPSLTGSHGRTFTALFEHPVPPPLDLVRTEPPTLPAALLAGHWLVVIDHHEARIYRSTAPGTVPQQIRPHAPEDFFRHAPNSKEPAHDQGKPAPDSFFEPVAGLLNGAGAVLVFGGGTDAANEMDPFVAWLKHHRPAVAQRVVGSMVIDVPHLTEAQVLAKARKFFASPRMVRP